MKKSKKEAAKHYKNVFEETEIDDDLKAYKNDRDQLCKLRLEQAAQNKTPQWSVSEVKFAIKDLNIGISKDPHGQPNELFKEGVAGAGLINAVTKLMNLLKDNPKEYPECMDVCNVTSIYKNKRDRNSYDSHRGVFRTTTLRNILDRLMYNDEYSTVDKNLTDCNVGARKKRNMRDNLFSMNVIMNGRRQGIEKACDICVYDVKKCFDKLWMSECINDLYEAGLTNDKLCLIYYSNRTARIAIKTPNGMSERFNIYEKVMQGTVWAGLMCTCTMDKLGQLAYQDKSLLYKYRGEVEVPPLEMIDDIITANNCGKQVIQTNAAVNTFIKLKKLKLSESKCARIHVGKGKCDQCLPIVVNKKPIKESHQETYLGDYMTKNANPKATIENRKGMVSCQKCMQ